MTKYRSSKTTPNSQADSFGLFKEVNSAANNYGSLVAVTTVYHTHEGAGHNRKFFKILTSSESLMNVFETGSQRA
jgi:hypothetical protein